MKTKIEELKETAAQLAADARQMKNAEHGYELEEAAQHIEEAIIRFTRWQILNAE